MRQRCGIGLCLNCKFKLTISLNIFCNLNSRSLFAFQVSNFILRWMGVYFGDNLFHGTSISSRLSINIWNCFVYLAIFDLVVVQFFFFVPLLFMKIYFEKLNAVIVLTFCRLSSLCYLS